MELLLSFNGTPAQFGAACEIAAAQMMRSASINLTVSPDSPPDTASMVRVRITSQDWRRHSWITARRGPDDAQTLLSITAEDSHWTRLAPEWERVRAALEAQGWSIDTATP